MRLPETREIVMSSITLVIYTRVELYIVWSLYRMMYNYCEVYDNIKELPHYNGKATTLKRLTTNNKIFEGAYFVYFTIRRNT